MCGNLSHPNRFSTGAEWSILHVLVLGFAKYSKRSSEAKVSYTLRKHHRVFISRCIQNGWAFKMIVVLWGCAIAVDHAFNYRLPFFNDIPRLHCMKISHRLPFSCNSHLLLEGNGLNSINFPKNLVPRSFTRFFRILPRYFFFWDSPMIFYFMCKILVDPKYLNVFLALTKWIHFFRSFLCKAVWKNPRSKCQDQCTKEGIFIF